MKKTLQFLLIITLIISFSNAEEIKTALLLVDIQNFYFPSENNPGLVGAEDASQIAQEVLQEFRKNDNRVVHIRHKAKNGFEIHDNVKPLPNEKIITKTEVNSFNGTDLLEYLQSNEISRLVIIGMQTHMCMEGATRAAYDHGFECIVIEDACATRDLTFGATTVKASDVHASTLESLTYGGYAKVIDLEEFKANLNKYLSEPIK